MARTKSAVRRARTQSTAIATTSQHDRPCAVTLDELRHAIRSLSDAEHLELFESLGFKAESEVIVTIYDGQQHIDDRDEGRFDDNDEERPNLILRPRAVDVDRPRAVVTFGPRTGTERQEIDILASVLADAANIGHPAILCAIRFWEGSVICRSRLSGMGRGEGARLAKCGKIAETHLRNLGKVLLQGAREKSWPAKYAFDVYRGVFDMNFYLKLVFEAYCNSGSREPGALIEMVRTRLSQDELCEDGALRGAHSPEALEILDLGFEYIRGFLESDVGRLAFERRQLRRWENLYDEWRFGLEPDVQRRYRGSAAGETSKPITIVGAEALWPDTNRNTLNHPVVLSPDRNWYTVSATGAAFNLPVVPVMKK